MNKSRVLNLLKTIINSIIVGGEIYYFIFIFFFRSIAEAGPRNYLFYYYTNISNAFLGLIALIALVFNITSLIKNENRNPKFVNVLYLIAVSMMTTVFVCVLAYLLPKDGFLDVFSFGLGRYFSHGVAPILALIVYIFLMVENTTFFPFALLGFIPFALYGSTYAICVYGLVIMPDVYGLGHPDNLWLIILLISLVAFMAPLLLWLLNFVMNRIIIGYVYQVEDKTTKSIEKEEDKIDEVVEEINKEESISKTTNKPIIPTKNDKKVNDKMTKPKTPINNKYKDGARVYHISRNMTFGKQWQVKLATGEKAIKLFPTQLEAINYAKGLVKTQGGSIRIHSVKGRLRK